MLRLLLLVVGAFGTRYWTREQPGVIWPEKLADILAVQRRICTRDVRFPPYVTPQAQDFILRLLELKPEDRMPLSSVRGHPWIVNNVVLD